MSQDQADRRTGRRVAATTISAGLLLVVLALVAAGCGGGGSSDKKANEAYANSVCGAIATWEQQIKTIATTFNGTVTQAALQEKVTQAEAATKTLATDIKAVPPPDTSQGQAAKQQLDQLSTDVTTTVSAVKNAVSQINGDASATDIALALVGVVPQVKSLATSTESAIKSLKDAGGSLASAFKGADSCQSLGL